MAEANTSTILPEGANSIDVAGSPAQSTQERTLALRLAPVNNSDQPMVANASNIHLAPGMAYLDFGFIEPGVLAALPRMAQQGGKLPDEINGKLAVRVVMGFDALVNLQRQLTRVMGDLTNAAKQEREKK